MPLGLLGKKIGHTRVYDATGNVVPVTVVLAGPNRVLQVKTQAGKDGYNSVQLGFDDQKDQRLSKALLGHIKKQNGAAVKRIREFRDFSKDVKPGDIVGPALFAPGDFIDAIGTTKGRGFEGVMKRHNFAGGMKTHGNSVSHRAPGSIGQRQTPGRVFKGKRMSGHMGVKNRTIENLRIVEVDVPRNLLLISGAVPGAEGGRVIVRPSVKATGQARRRKLMPNKAPAAAKGAPAAKGAAKADKK